MRKIRKIWNNLNLPPQIPETRFLAYLFVGVLNLGRNPVYSHGLGYTRCGATYPNRILANFTLSGIPTRKKRRVCTNYTTLKSKRDPIQL
ncbi:hypothetical protein BI308_07280 [Roseofilum reptotaenium AO1-A]|uniref:Uncharacterized protein n=1 Tax=Roseofilum reptotaenium AO1-A TaxID=1925591 RepID=A0A1L9QU52_9CYAN|nr:hypothetical protein BI308_07280 [Roseofilum reptotaenium AO1-A]